MLTDEKNVSYIANYDVNQPCDVVMTHILTEEKCHLTDTPEYGLNKKQDTDSKKTSVQEHTFLSSLIVPSAMVTCDKHRSGTEVVIVLGYTVGSVKCCLSVLVLHSLRLPWFLVLLLLLLAPTWAGHPSATATKHTYSQKIVSDSCDIDKKSLFTIFCIFQALT